ncbi:MAG: Wadjet anti-phage system protein JetD domain-containing protein [Thermodesulfobacteriota bacterium]
MTRDALPVCLVWQRLLTEGSAPPNPALEGLIQAGYAHTDKGRVRLDEYEALAALVDQHCREPLARQKQAENTAAALGIEISVTAHAEDCLTLLSALEQDTPDAHTQQQLSASCFGDSKYIARTGILKRLWQQWLRTQGARGEMRLKAFSALPHHSSGLDLATVTAALGSALLDAPTARSPLDFDLRGLTRVVTCENLTPFRQLTLDTGLLIYSQGFASRSLSGWLAALPDTCVWTHFGDLDAAGLAIFEDLLRKSGVQGHFCPDPDALNSVREHLPQWPGHQAVQPDRYATSQVRALARRAATLDTAVEQEGLLAACARAGVDVAAIGLQGAYWSP